MGFFDDAVAASEAGNRGRPIRERFGVPAVLLVLVVLGGLTGGGWAYAHDRAQDRLPAGTTIGGVAVGGLDLTAAEQRLRTELGARLDRPIRLITPAGSTSVDPRAAGLGVDYRATLAPFTTPVGWRPEDLWAYYTGEHEVTPVLALDQQALSGTAAKVVARLDQPGRNAAVRFVDGRMQVQTARAGAGLQPDVVAAAIERAYVAGDDSAAVPLTAVAPPVTDHAAQAAIDRYVNPALASPVILRFGRHPVQLRPAAYHDALTLVPHQGVLRLGVDGAALMRLVRPAIEKAPGPVDATVRLVDGAPAVVPGRPGRTYGADAVQRTFLRLVTATRTAGRTGSVPATAVRPQVDAAQVAALDVDQQVASATVTARGVSTADLRAQVATADQTLVRPGATFSLLRAVGTAPGDLTTLATAVHRATYAAGLSDVEHVVPAAHVSGYPVGLEATAVRGVSDLQVRDDLPSGVLLSLAVAPGGHSVTATLWSTPAWRVSVATACSRIVGAGRPMVQVATTRTLAPLTGSAAARTDRSTATYPSLPHSACPDLAARRPTR